MSSQWPPKRIFVLVVDMTAVLVTFIGVQKLGSNLGISQWSTLLTALAVFLVAMALSQWRKLYPPNRLGLVLMTIGISVLTVCSLVNEFVVPFFKPTRVHLAVALLPSIAYAAFQYMKSRNAPPDDESH
jgi:xanthine/uracil permease